MTKQMQVVVKAGSTVGGVKMRRDTIQTHDEETAMQMIAQGIATDATIRTRGQIVYDADCERQPLYHDGTTRRTWHDLSEVERWSWERNPTPR
jgi:hypothetical protein